MNKFKKLEQIRKRHIARLDATGDFDEDEGSWITVKGSHIHLNEEGVADKGPKGAVDSINKKSAGKKTSGKKSSSSNKKMTESEMDKIYYDDPLKFFKGDNFNESYDVSSLDKRDQKVFLRTALDKVANFSPNTAVEITRTVKRNGVEEVESKTFYNRGKWTEDPSKEKGYLMRQDLIDRYAKEGYDTITLKTDD